MKNILIFLFVFLSANYCFSQTDIDKKVLAGLDDIYNLRFDEAEKVFKGLQKQYPANLKGYFYESLLYFYRALPSRDDAMFDRFYDLSEVVIEKAEDAIDKNENDYDAIYYKGLSHSYRSLLMLTLNKSLLKAASNGNDGYRILTSLIERKPDYYDAYMGLGLYKIAIGFVPEKFQWLLSLIGFNGSIKDGMELLRTSLSNGKFTKTDSKVFLSIFSIKERESEDKQALNFAKELTEQYPLSPIFKTFYAGQLLQNGLNEEAIRISEEALALNKYSFQNDIRKSSAAIEGSAYFRMNDYEKSAIHLEEFMKHLYPLDRFNVYAFTLGTAYELIGDRDKALLNYKIARDNFINERDGELDRFFYRYAQEKLKHPLTDIEKKMIEGLNLRESNKLQDAIELYNSMITSGLIDKNNSDDNRIITYYNLGLAYVYKRDLQNALTCFNKCITFDPSNEKWLLPHSYFELGKIYDKLGDKKKSQEMFEKIFDYDDFDFESFLEMRLANYLNN